MERCNLSCPQLFYFFVADCDLGRFDGPVRLLFLQASGAASGYFTQVLAQHQLYSSKGSEATTASG